MAEGYLFKLEVGGGDFGAGKQIVPEYGMLDGRYLVVAIQVGQVDDLLNGRQCLDDVGDFFLAVETLALVLVAVDAEQHARFDLREAVEYAGGAEVRRAGGPGGADAGSGQYGS